MAKHPTDELLREALQLPKEARAALAGLLIKSLDDNVDEDAESAWQIEIGKRIQEIDSGNVKMVSWGDSRRRIVRR
ncbi:MAG: addiction module protein [Planctomycetes bacterium]|nr:addiction module protein [Planctomycetota bacterium]